MILRRRALALLISGAFVPHAQGFHDPAQGGREVMATLYQNCEALKVPPLSPNFSLKGMKRYEITSASQMIASHPYLPKRGPNGPECFDITPKTPTYDFGGAPLGYVTSANEPALTLFRNAGTGMSRLGIDCSSFVTTSYLAQGLKLSTRQVDLTPRQFDAFDSRQYARAPSGVAGKPQGRMDCLQPVPIPNAEPLLPGDLIAWDGHIMMVEEIDGDPLGLRAKTFFRGCQPDSFPVSKMGFRLMHSSSDHGWIGVHRNDAAEYLPARMPGIAQHFREYAAAQCEARSRRGGGGDSRVVNAKGEVKFVVLRHRSLLEKRSIPECETVPIRLDHAACVRSCVEPGIIPSASPGVPAAPLGSAAN